ncbi:MAG TPA: hypothetical protein VMT18_02345 [Planctomycetota bacterium]|nr:hypothetical protein [Planctomycetota bacterium]
MKVALLVLAVLGGVWGARSLSGDTGPWDGADRHTTFFDDGSPRSSATLADGRLEGPARTWYAHGSLESEG